MNSTEIVLKRLIDLKKLSSQLKQQTEKTSTIDTSLVKAILETTKDVSPKKNQASQSTPRLQSQSSNNEIPLLRLIAATKEENKNRQSRKSFQDNGFKPLFPQNSNFPKKNSLPPSKQFIEDTEEQLINLKEQNLMLEKQMKEMQEELLAYKEKEAGQTSQQKEMPFFNLFKELLTFHTKISISEKDYNKIQFSSNKVELNLENIIISSRKSFSLSELNHVNYLDGNVIMLQFIDEEEQMTTLFIKFEDSENLHHWDLGIYINYKIINCLEEENLFMQEGKSRKEEKKEEQVGDMDNDQKKILKSFLDKKQQYLQAQKELKSSMLEKIQEVKKKKSTENSRISNQSEDKQLFDVFASQVKGQSKIVNDEQINFKKEKEPSEESPKPPSEDQIRELEEKKRKQEEQLKRVEEERQQKLREEEEKKKEEERIRQITLLKIQKQAEEKAASDRLKYGYTLIKYAKGAYNPHDKKVYLNLDGKKLCWEDKDANGKDVKSVLISEITSINLGQIGEGIEKHIGIKSKITNLNCFSTIFMKNKDRKSLQFGSKTPETMKQFVTNLQRYVDSLH